jgi:hypothetical protein
MDERKVLSCGRELPEGGCSGRSAPGTFRSDSGPLPISILVRLHPVLGNTPALIGLVLANWLRMWTSSGPPRLNGAQVKGPERSKKGGLAESLDFTPSFSPSRPARGTPVLASALRAALTAALRWPASGSGNPARESSGEQSCRIIIFLL